MLIFHEGLPGSGKSYEAVVNRIIPALKEGRQVFAYIEGLNYEKFSEITGISLDVLKGVTEKIDITNNLGAIKKAKYTQNEGKRVYSIEYKGLLHQLKSEEVPMVFQYVANDSLVILDELQDYFPVSTRRLSEGITKFVTQHRHRGIDVIVMGQDHRDCHNLWKRRIDQLVHFVKRDVIGRPNDYTWVTYKQNQGKMIKIRSGKGSYDEKYFGLYDSHVPGAENTETYKDDRVNIFKSAAFNFYLPLFGAVLIGAMYFLYGFFSGERVGVRVDDKPKVEKVSSSPSTGTSVRANSQKESSQKRLVRKDYTYENYVVSLSNNYRPRLSGLVENEHKIMAYVEFLDDSYHVKEKLELKQLVSLGWDYVRVDYGIKLVRGDQELVVTAWPLDSVGKVSNYTRSQL